MKKIFLVFLVLIFSISADTIKGIVVNSSEKPIPDAEVKIEAIQPLTEKDSKITKTNKNGEFIFQNIKTGYYYLKANKDDYLQKNMGRIEINEAKYGVKSYKIVLPKPSSISGYVYDEEKKTISGVKVGNYETHVYTDKNGFYRITGLPPGVNFLICEKDGYVKEQKNNIELEEGKEKGGIDFTLQFAGNIKGFILDENNKPIKNAYVNANYVVNGDYIYVAKAKSDDRGQFILTRLPQGIYKISVYAQGYEWGYAGNIEVKKKETTEIQPVHLSLRPKSFYIFTKTNNFLPDEKICLYYSAFRISNIRLSIYEVNILNELNKFSRISFFDNENLLFWIENNIDIAKTEPVFEKEFNVNYPHPLADLYNKKIELDKLSAGVYLIIAKGDELVKRKLIIVTDIGIITKSVENQNYICVIDLKTGQPL